RLPRHTVYGIAHADAALAFEDQRRRQRALLDQKVFAAPRGIEIAMGGALAAALGDRHLRHAYPFLALAILVGIERQADLLGGFDDHLEQRHPTPWRVGHAQKPGAAAILIRAAVIALHALEDRQHVLIAPAAIAELRPVVIVLRLTADIDHAVDRARPAQHLAARHVDLAAAGALVRFGAVAPVDGGIVDHLGDADRHPRPEEIGTFDAGFQQQHAIRAALGQAACDHRTGRTCPDDDVVIDSSLRHGARI